MVAKKGLTCLQKCTCQKRSFNQSLNHMLSHHSLKATFNSNDLSDMKSLSLTCDKTYLHTRVPYVLHFKDLMGTIKLSDSLNNTFRIKISRIDSYKVPAWRFVMFSLSQKFRQKKSPIPGIFIKRLSPAIKLSFTQALLPITLLTSPLEQFVLLAKSARGAAAVELIKQVLEVLSLFILQG